MHGIVKKKNLIVLHQRGEAVRKSGTEKNCGKIAENCGKLRKIAENCEKLRNCGKLRKIADLNFSPPLTTAIRPPISARMRSQTRSFSPAPGFESRAAPHGTGAQPLCNAGRRYVTPASFTNTFRRMLRREELKIVQKFSRVPQPCIFVGDRAEPTFGGAGGGDANAGLPSRPRSAWPGTQQTFRSFSLFSPELSTTAEASSCFKLLWIASTTSATAFFRLRVQEADVALTHIATTLQHPQSLTSAHALG